MKVLFYLIWFYNIIEVICQTNITSRLFPACSIVESTLYCFGGTTSYSKRYYNIINEHVSLDLSALNNSNTTVSISSLQWKTLSNSLSTTSSSTLPPIMRGGTTTIHSNNSYLIYSGASTRNTLTNYIYNYHVSTNQWSTLSLPTGNNYTSDGSMINLGNDTIWVWGGRSLTNDSSINSNVYSTFDYNHMSWSQSITNDWQMLTGYSATLAQNGIIYVLGGYDDSNSILVNFNQIRTFNTQSSSWSSINSTNGKSPSNRMYHSVTNIPDKNLLFIYGGIFYNRTSTMMINDISYVYNYVNNTFTSVSLPASTSQNNNNRYGHFATVLKQSNYLLLAFGFNDVDTGASNSINVLNVADPFHPILVTQTTVSPTSSPSNNDNNNNNNNNNQGHQSGLSGGVIAAIVIVIVVVICIIGGIFFYLHRKRKQQQEENQKMMSKQDFLQRGLDDQYGNNNSHYGLYNSSVPPLPQNRGINENNIRSSYENEKLPSLPPQSQQQQYQTTSPSPLYTVTSDPNNNENDQKSKGIKSYGAQLNYDIFNSSEFDFLHQQQQQQQQQHNEK